MNYVPLTEPTCRTIVGGCNACDGPVYEDDASELYCEGCTQ